MNVHVCQQFERISSAKSKIHFVLFYVYASMIPVLIFSLHLSIQVVAFAYPLYPTHPTSSHQLTVPIPLYTLRSTTASLHPGCNTLIYVTYIVNVLHDKSDVNFPFENKKTHTKKKNKLTTDFRCNLWGMKTHRTRIIGRSICLIYTHNLKHQTGTS